MSFRFSRASEARLADLDHRLARVFRRALGYGVMDFTVTQTLRSLEEQKAAVARGASKTMNSKHLAGPDGRARAGDIAPWPIDWSDAMRFHVLGGLVLAAAAEEGVAVRWGGQWDRDFRTSAQTFNDLPHFELV